MLWRESRHRPTTCRHECRGSMIHAGRPPWTGPDWRQTGKCHRFTERFLKKCVACGKTFVVVPTGISRKTCSEPCKQRHKRNTVLKYSRRTPAADSLVGWHKHVWARLRSRKPQKNEEWIMPGDAVKVTGLTHRQLYYLKHRRMLRTKNSRRMTRWGSPVPLYAASEIAIVAEVLKAQRRKRRRRK